MESRTTGASPLAQDYTLVWHNPDSEYFVDGCGPVHLDAGQ